MKMAMIPDPSPRCRFLVLMAIRRQIRESKFFSEEDIDVLTTRLQEMDLMALLMLYEHDQIGNVLREGRAAARAAIKGRGVDA